MVLLLHCIIDLCLFSLRRKVNLVIEEQRWGWSAVWLSVFRFPHLLVGKQEGACNAELQLSCNSPYLLRWFLDLVRSKSNVWYYHNRWLDLCIDAILAF